MYLTQRLQQRFSGTVWRLPSLKPGRRAVVWRGEGTRVIREQSTRPVMDVPVEGMQRWTPIRPALRADAGLYLRYPAVPPDRPRLQVGAASHFADMAKRG